MCDYSSCSLNRIQLHNEEKVLLKCFNIIYLVINFKQGCFCSDKILNFCYYNKCAPAFLPFASQYRKHAEKQRDKKKYPERMLISPTVFFTTFTKSNANIRIICNNAEMTRYWNAAESHSVVFVSHHKSVRQIAGSRRFIRISE